jgi:hypothetical protein
MSGSGYDAVVDVDDEVRQGVSLTPRTSSPSQLTTISPQGDLGHTDLQEDLEFHTSTFTTTPSRSKSAPSSGLPPPATSSNHNDGSKRFLWSISFYAQFFDVDTSAVLSRCWAALYPRANFLDVLEGNPDLYGPFWIATTVVLILFLGGTISQSIGQHGDAPFAYDFRLLSGTFFLVCTHLQVFLN